MTEANYLDAIFNLRTVLFRPFLKKLSAVRCVSTESSHPAYLLKHLYKFILVRLFANSSNEYIFKDTAITSQKAFSECKHTARLTFESGCCGEYHKKTKNNNRKRKGEITCFNPSYNINVKDCGAKKFLKFIDKHFFNSPELKRLLNGN